MTHVNATVVRYIAAWNERDPKRRRELVGETWTDDGSYVDAHRNGSGHGAIDTMIAAAQAQFPTYRLNLVSGIEAHNNFARFLGLPAAAKRRRSISAALISPHWALTDDLSP
ncbi:MAG: hypothetical protein WA851_02130 [Xanthobacteraceae bacterium]